MKLATTLLIALSAAVASAATTTYTPLTDTEGWVLGRRDDGKQLFTIDAAAGTISVTNSNWGQETAVKQLSAIALTQPTDSMTFSYTLYNNDNNVPFSVALVGSSQAIVMGTLAYNSSANTQYAVTDVLPSTFDSSKALQYTIEQIATEDIVKLSDKGAPYTITYTASIAWSDTSNQFELSVSDGTNTHTGIALGDAVDFNQVYISADGHSGQWGWTASDLSISVTTADAPSENIPEPTTATLSLLALTGLAARRRRK